MAGKVYWLTNRNSTGYKIYLTVKQDIDECSQGVVKMPKLVTIYLNDFDEGMISKYSNGTKIRKEIKLKNKSPQIGRTFG